jgi:HEAT repeat protein
MANDRVAELKALGKSKDVIGAVDKLAKALDSLDDPTREATLSALRELLAAKGFPKIFEDDMTPLRTRRNVLKALRYLKEPKYTPMVVAALSEKDAGIRTDAAWTLSVFGAAEGEAALIKAVADPEKEVRYYAADALGQLKSEGAKKAVLERQKVEKDNTVLYALQQAEKKQR